jgi:tRNA(Glu) U13 pseudouridine synthase TruD
MTIGIAGLKDKKALTRQRITIYDRALAKLGGERLFIDSLKKIVKVLEVTRHKYPIGMTTPISNQFHIRLRAEGRLSKDEKIHALDFATATLRE